MYEGDLKRNLAVSRILEPLPQLFSDLEELSGEPGTNHDAKATKVDTAKEDVGQVKKEQFETDEAFPPSPEYSSTNIAQPSTSKQTSELPPGHAPCPICAESFLVEHMNFHIDDCLKRPNKKQEEKKCELIKMPIFYVMKDSELKRRLRDEGIEFRGDRKILETRLKEFITLWNSTRDDDEPPSRDAVLKYLKRQESFKAKTQNSVSKFFQFGGKEDQSIIDSKKEEYLKEHKQQFSELIARAKEKRRQASSTVTNNNKTPEIQDGTPQKNTLAMDEMNKKTDNDNNKTPTIQGSTPKRKTPPLDEGNMKTNETPSKRKMPGLAEREAANVFASSPKSTSMFNFKTPPKPVSKIPCPVCNELISEKIIQIHVEKCLDKSESQNVNMNDTEEEVESEDQNTSYDLLCTTPEIIEGSSPDIVHSTPQRRNEEETITTRSMRSKRGTK